MYEKRIIIGYIRAAVPTKKLMLRKRTCRSRATWWGTKKSNEYKDHRKIDRVWYESKSSIRVRSTGVDLEWPWRGTALDGAELPVTCSLPARRCGRHPSFLSRPLSRETSDSLLNVSVISKAFPASPSILLISFHLSYVREATHNWSIKTIRLKMHSHTFSFSMGTLLLNYWTASLLRWISNST